MFPLYLGVCCSSFFSSSVTYSGSLIWSPWLSLITVGCQLVYVETHLSVIILTGKTHCGQVLSRNVTGQMVDGVQ